MDATARFEALLAGPEPALPLDEAALLIAAHDDPDLDVDEALGRIDELADGVRAPTLDGLLRHLFRELGFAGAEGAAYHDPRSSYLHHVVERRIGIPIALSILVMEVGRRIGVPLAGVSMPGHFLIRDKVDPEVFVDPFARGAQLDRRGAQARFHVVQGPGSVFHPDFLEPADRRSIVRRVLANLEGIATHRGDRDMLEWVLRLRNAVPGAPTADRRRLAALLAAVGKVVEGAAVLEALAVDLEGEEAQTAADAAQRLRAQLN